jgi:hypothetical protein
MNARGRFHQGKTVNGGGPARAMARIACALSAAASLACCGALEEGLYKPIGTFDLYGCQQLADLARSNRTREAELRHLMELAETGAAGQAAVNMAYRSEYMRARAYQKHALELAAKKNCAADSRWSSEREVR